MLIFLCYRNRFNSTNSKFRSDLLFSLNMIDWFCQLITLAELGAMPKLHSYILSLPLMYWQMWLRRQLKTLYRCCMSHLLIVSLKHCRMVIPQGGPLEPRVPNLRILKLMMTRLPVFSRPYGLNG